MLSKLFFRYWPSSKQILYLRKNGVLIGSRKKDGKKVFMYMLDDNFAEVIFTEDDPDQQIISGNVVIGLKNFNRYLENDFRTTF